jgi:hypothetical protein
MIRKLFPFFTFVWLISGGLLFADSTATFKRSVPLAPADHLILDVTIPEGTVNIHYAHAGEISVAATAKMDEGEIPADFFEKWMTVAREGNHLKVQYAPDAKTARQNARITFNIGVPYWLEVNSNVGSGRQSVLGIQGPVKLVSGRGDIEADYITTTLDATTGHGNIKVIRVGTAARVETGTGNINLKDIGPGSIATVKKGIGKIEMDGVSGTFMGSTDAGDLIAKGQVFDAWDLKSVSGDLRIEIAQEEGNGYEIDAATRSGRLSVENEEIELADKDARACHQKIDGGGKLVRARSVSGNILLQ